MKHQQRPRSITCPDCGEGMHLVNCGVDGHQWPFRLALTRQERLAGACNGRVYAHVATGGMECDR